MDFDFSSLLDISVSNAEAVQFMALDIDLTVANQQRLKSWISGVITSEKSNLVELSFVFCSDEHLRKINIEYLSHDYYTDVITFPLASPPLIHGDIMISIDRVRENAQTLDQPFELELYRVMIHGVLHLCGYDDQTPAAKALMRQKEDEKLSLLPNDSYLGK